MSDGSLPDEDATSLVAPDPSSEVTLDVELVVPAAAYEAVSTEDTPRPQTDDSPMTPHSTEAIVQAVEALGGALGRRLDLLQSTFEREVRAEATREKVVDRLHAELQEYKQDLLLNVLRPIFVDLIQLHDDIGKMVEAQADGGPDVDRLLELMRGVQQGIEDILYRQGVEPFHLDGASFDPRRQRAVATVATDDAALNKTIAVRHRKGFQAGEKVIRPEIVSVFAFRK